MARCWTGATSTVPAPTSLLNPLDWLYRAAAPSAWWRTAGPNWLNSDRKSTRLNSSHRCISYALFFLRKVVLDQFRHGQKHLNGCALADCVIVGALEL